MDIKKFKVIAYVMYRRLQGYKLLRNAPGTPWTSVKMMKYRHWLAYDQMDIYNDYWVLSADFSAPKKQEKKEWVFCTRYAFYDEATSKINYHKDMRYYRMKPEPVKVAFKNLIDSDVLMARNLDYIKKVVQRKITDKLVFFLFFPLGTERVVTDITYGDIAHKKFREKYYEDAEARRKNYPFFLKTLYRNLSR